MDTQLRKCVYNVFIRDYVRNKTQTRSPRPRAADTKKAGDAGGEKPVALTLKVDHATYVRLCTLGATERRTNQDILQQALQEYLDRSGS
jgi:hypothetical protein